MKRRAPFPAGLAPAAAAVLVALLAGAMAAHAGTSPTAPTKLPAEMKAVRFHEYGGADRLRVERVPVPRPGPGEVLVEVHAASVNPIDWKLREGLARGWWPLQLPSIPGRDAAGIVRSVGDGVTKWRAGDAVVAEMGSDGAGSFAEYAVVAEGALARKPPQLSFVDAAAYPLVALTAWDAVLDADVRAGDVVLVQGGAGGVGAFAVQFAALRGARVIATASARNFEYVRSLGAAQVIDYRATRFEDAVQDVDVVLDTVGGETLTRSVAVVKRGGRLATVAGRVPEDACRARGITCAYSNADSSAGRLAEVSALVAQGKARVLVDRVYRLEQAGEAMEANRAGGGTGKIVVQVKEGADERP